MKIVMFMKMTLNELRFIIRNEISVLSEAKKKASGKGDIAEFPELDAAYAKLVGKIGVEGVRSVLTFLRPLRNEDSPAAAKVEKSITKSIRDYHKASGGMNFSVVYLALRGATEPDLILPLMKTSLRRIFEGPAGENPAQVKRVMNGRVSFFETLGNILVEAKLESKAAETSKSGNKKKKKAVPPEAPSPPAPLGDYAFATQRDDVPPEANTPAEDKLERELTYYFRDNKPVSNNSAEVLKTLASNDWYPKIIKKPRGREMLRGMNVPESWITANLGKGWQKQLRVGIGEIETSFTFEPRSGISSWTSDMDVARMFSSGKKVPIILHARVQENPGTFVSGPEGFYKIRSFASYADKESEVLAAGPVEVYMITFP